MGDSITEGWSVLDSGYFEGKPYINRGISGQTTPQMLVRFRADVLDLKPSVVVILAGTNDIAGNTGPATLESIAGNIASMSDLARAHGIRVIISSVLPAADYPWRPGLEPDKKIPVLNAILKTYARENDALVSGLLQRYDRRSERNDRGVRPRMASTPMRLGMTLCRHSQKRPFVARWPDSQVTLLRYVLRTGISLYIRWRITKRNENAFWI